MATSTPPGQMETQVAATIYAEQTSVAQTANANQTSTAAKQSPFHAALTADALTAAVRTPVPTSSMQKYEVSIPASACCRKYHESHFALALILILTGMRILVK